MPYEDVSVSVRESVGHIRLERASSNDTVRPETMRELASAIDSLVADPEAKAIALSSAGKHFCAGADFDFLATLPDKPPQSIYDQVYEAFQGAARRLYLCPKPTVAVIRGAAVTVGCELALACDFRVGAASTRLHESWIELGLIPPLGGLFLLPRYVGLGLAKEMILNARRLTGEEAFGFGLLNELVEEVELDKRGHILAQSLGERASEPFRIAKSAISRGLESVIDREWDAYALAQSTLFGAPEFRNKLAAIHAHRAAAST